MRKRLSIQCILIAAAMEWAFAQVARADIDPLLRCQFGAYTLSDGRTVVVDGYDGTPHDLQYVLSSGEYGHLTFSAPGTYELRTDARAYGSASFSNCGKSEVMFTEDGRPALQGKKISEPAVETDFESSGIRLHGKLVMPPTGKADAIVVMIQGSEDDPGTDDDFWQYELPLRGIGVFTYDKRGSGRSTGEASADFYQRAADTAAAVRKARELSSGTERIGVFGGSQGGWVAPLTATQTSLNFVIVGYGLAEGVTAQDRDDVEEMVRAAGYGDDAISKVREITGATARVVKSEWTDGWEELAAVERKYRHEPWYKAIDGENGYTAILLRTPEATARQMGPKLDKHVSFSYDPRPIISSIAPRQLWVLGGADHTAPSSRTIEILTSIQREKPSLDLVVYKNADHGIVEEFASGDIKRHRFPQGYFDLIGNWIKAGELPQSDGDLIEWKPQR
jgi:pimeloyl-ACP methyl ester carboxylesterase